MHLGFEVSALAALGCFEAPLTPGGDPVGSSMHPGLEVSALAAPGFSLTDPQHIRVINPVVTQGDPHGRSL